MRELLRKEFGNMAAENQKPSHKVYVALLHNPVYNKRGEIVTSALTNIDVHDISRASQTYELGGFFIVHPLEEQRKLANNILGHWTEGKGSLSNPKRKNALDIARVVSDLDEAKKKIEEFHGKAPKVIATKANPMEGEVSFDFLKSEIDKQEQPFLLCLGTAWGLSKEFLNSADILLAPIRPNSSFRHLSVRSAASIMFDRLIGD